MANPPRSPCVAPSSVANQSLNQPSPQCCCFSARFVNLVLFLFNFIFLLSGIIILLLTLLYGRPEVSRYLGETTKYLNNIISLLGRGHLVQIIHYAMLFCGITISSISLVNIFFSLITSWSKSSDYYYYKRKQKLNENESLINNSTLESTSRRSTCSNEVANNGRVVNDSTSSSKDKSFLTHCANSPYALWCYIVILILLFTIQLVVGLLSVVAVSPEHVFLTSSLMGAEPDDAFLVSVRESVDVHHLLVDRAADIEPLYRPFKCCGWDFFDDYEFLVDGHGYDKSRRNKTASVPDACCKTLVHGCGVRKHPNNIYYDGCWTRFGAELRDYVLMLGWTALCFSVVELIGLMFAICHYIQTVSRSR